MTEAYYERDGVTILHGDCREFFPLVCDVATVMVTDPPYGIAYDSRRPRAEGNARSIQGDGDSSLRDDALAVWAKRPALVFGSPKAAKPSGVRQTLIWDQGGALGMGDLSIPWKPSWQEIYVLGGPWAGRRDCGSVLQYPPVQSMGRAHPHEKPVWLLKALLAKCIEGMVIDPFAGSGSTGCAALAMGRGAILIEVDERYCEVAVKRLQQAVLPMEVA